MDKNWMHLPSRLVPEYEEGVQKIIAQAKNYAKTREVILCPCKRCKNKKYMKFDQVYGHLIIKGIDPSYTIWFWHGEFSTPQSQGEGTSQGYIPLAHKMEKASPADTKTTRSQVCLEGHKQRNEEPSTQVARKKMKKTEECLLKSQNTTNIVGDEISFVFGKEAKVGVCGMGSGVIPSKVGASVQQNITLNEIRSMMDNFKQDFKREIQEMRSMILQNMRQPNNQKYVVGGYNGSGIGNEVGGGSDINGAKKSDSVESVNQELSIAQTNPKNVSCGDIRDNTKCKLLHWCIDEVVAEGRIASTDPKTKVHNIFLGGGGWKVWVDRVFVEKVELIRPNDEMFFLEDAIGSTIAWISKFIVLCD